jgi:hypothetical protein
VGSERVRWWRGTHSVRAVKWSNGVETGTLVFDGGLPTVVSTVTTSPLRKERPVAVVVSSCSGSRSQPLVDLELTRKLRNWLSVWSIL